MSPAETTTLAPSRIPIRRARRASDLGPPPSGTRSPAASSTGRSHTPRGAPSSPMKLSPRRYSPNRHVETNHSLTAVIREPPPKLSPPLRSSRPRQTVSDATTAASRARVTERFTKSTTKERPVPRGPPKDYVHVDVASRRDQVHTKLSRTYVGRPKGDDGSRTPTSPTSTTSPTSPVQHTSPIQHRNAQHRDNHLPVLEDTTAGAERDLSPVIEDESWSPKNTGDSLAPGDFSFTPSTQGAKHSLLRQVMILRDDSSSKASSIKVPEDLLSELGEAETVQLFLGETPKLPSENFAPPQAPAVPESEEQEFDFADGRSSICPDDSVSVVYSRRMEPKSERLPPLPPMPLSLDSQHTASYTVDSAARSQINRVLEQYQEGTVTPEQAQELKEQIEQLTPNMAQHTDWDNIERTKQYLNSVLEETDGDQPAVQTPTTDRSTSRPPSILNDLMDDDEYRGTAIIYTDRL
jgi:hypothetical protein